MKKLLIFLAITGSVAACGDAAQNDAATGDDTSTTAITPVKDSLMQFKEGKVRIMTGGSWADLSGPVTTTNGRKVSPDGEVSKGTVTRKMEEGMMIDKDGQLMDKDGKMIDNTGWE